LPRPAAALKKFPVCSTGLPEIRAAARVLRRARPLQPAARGAPLRRAVRRIAFSGVEDSPSNRSTAPHAMPIYEFACPKCRRIFSFLSKRVNPDRLPACPRCGNRNMVKQISRFATVRGLKEPGAPAPDPEGAPPMPDLDDPRVERAMRELERDMDHLDENNPKHMAHMMRKMKDLMPPGTVPKELDVAIKRLEAGEDPEKIEEDMGEVLGDWFGEGEDSGGGEGGYSRDPGLYDY
jgi:putative FmdB family regulatory protein